MPTLLLRFPGRRYHATPWGNHVNEGLIEWPPSPWRILRALLSVGYSACAWPADVSRPWLSSPPAPARRLLEQLASVAPRYALPPATGAHTRHYMPTAELKAGQERTTMVFDTWAQIESGELAITWDLQLDDEALGLLADLAGHLNYLGRSESWVHARLAAGDQVRVLDYNCWPSDRFTPRGPGWEQLALLSPLDVPKYAQWRAEALRRTVATPPSTAAVSGGTKPRGNAEVKLEADRAARTAMFPRDTLACLHVDNNFLHQHGWSQPPGTQRQLYWRRSDALQGPRALLPQFTAMQSGTVHAVLLALASESLNTHALPAVARTLPQAEILHRQVLGAFGKLGPALHSPVLSGCDAQGRPRRGAHRHAHVLPLDLDGDGHLDHLLIWAPEGLPSQEQQALRQIRGTYTKGGVGALRMAWVGAGELADFGTMLAPQGEALDRTLGAGRHWVSATPFVPPRHVKVRGPNTMAGQVTAELASRGLPAPEALQWLDPREHEHARQLRHFVRVRRLGRPPPVNEGFALKLSFAKPLVGPLCLGYGSHFGLGRFEHAPAR